MRVRGTGPSCQPVTLPKGGYIRFLGEAALARFRNRRAFVIAQNIDAFAPRFDFTGKLGQFLLVFFRPGFDLLE
ncbi:MAG TPA: hypothetical protein VJL90_01955 [Pseudorhodoplanes sp.]|nr:hypothetical protein [Pseudorhodoplanes sp.]